MSTASCFPRPRPAPTAASPWTLAMLTANAQSPYLQLEDEIRGVEEALQGARHRALYRLRPVLAVTFNRLLVTLDDEEPALVHVSAHALRGGVLALKDPRGGTHPVPPAHFVELLSSLPWPPWLVTFATCHSAELARAAAKVTRYTIGFEGPIADATLLAFSAMFYERLAARALPDVPRAFKVACLACRAASFDDIERARLFEEPGREVGRG